MQVVGVEAVAEVDGQCEWPEILGGPQASADRGQAVAAFPCMLMTFCELADTHVARLEDYMLCVIQLPILRQDTPLTFQSRVQWRPREWRQHGEARQIDARIDGEFNLSDGRRFATYGTMYGDGEYCDQYGNRYSVDAGLIGCIRIEDIRANKYGDITELGAIVEFETDFVTGGGRDDPNWEGTIQFGRIAIETGDDPDSYEEEDYEYDEE